MSSHLAPLLIAGVPYVTAALACALLAGSGVTPTLVRRWAADGLLQPARTPTGQVVRIPGHGGRGQATVYPWLDVLEVERTTRLTRAGRPRATPLNAA